MTDLEMTKLCAEAMGLRLILAYRKGTILYDEGQHDWNGLMYSRDGNHLFVESGAYNPLHDDAQAMALVKKFRLQLQGDADTWWALSLDTTGESADHTDLNRAIVACVANMQSGAAPGEVLPTKEK